jgi:parallel beta-helix repeat protein
MFCFTSNRSDRIRTFCLNTMLAVAICQTAMAATLCVNPGGKSGCYAKIQDAVNAAAAYDTINVAQGTYKEDVVIGRPLSLVGHNSSNTVIDASGLLNGVYIDGLDNPGLANVVVTGFTVKNANIEGIVITNASNVTVSYNQVLNNNLGLDINDVTCPGAPPWETLEGFDCGEGIHLSGVDHSVVANNTAQYNAGGILLSDDTGPTHDNLISNNIVTDNPYDCGVTLASHPPAAITGATAPFGVFHNTISGNTSSRNGTQVPGAGAGVGIFDSFPGTKNYGNVIINNRLTNNGLPGVAMHGHAPFQDLTNNMIIGNYIAGNGADTDDAFTPGPTGINVFGVSPASGTVISNNVIKDESVDIAVNTPAVVSAHLNNLQGKGTGVAILGQGSVDATENWWGCSGGPGANGCSTAAGTAVTFNPWLTTPF